MLFESAHVRVSAEYGVATLWLGFPGEPVNALDLARLAELDAALAALERNPFVRVLVVRSTKPAGFCAGIHPAALASLTTSAEAARFAWAGQQVLARLAALPVPSIAFIDGPCLGAGLELALACDHRLVLSQPRTLLGFPDAPEGVVPCFGGTVRLRQRIGRRAAERLLQSGSTLSGREARDLGLVDLAFCERRAKIELRTLLDRLERWAAVPSRCVEDMTGLARERRSFVGGLDTPAARAAITRQRDGLAASNAIPTQPFLSVVGLVGEDPAASRLVSGAVLAGNTAFVCGSGHGVLHGISTALSRGFVTPLEADQARSRVTISADLAGFDRAGLVVLADSDRLGDLAAVIRPRCVVAATAPVSQMSRRLVLLRPGDRTDSPILAPTPATDPEALAVAAAWLRALGLGPVFTSPPRESALAAA